MTPPHGYPAILRTYGCILGYVDDKPAWEAEVLRVVPIPQSIPYAYGPAEIAKIRGHKLVVELVVEGIAKALEHGVPRDRIHYGGMYAWRAQRGAAKLSAHAWGIAVDLEPAANPLGVRWDGGETRDPDTGTYMLHPVLVEVFQEIGFTWGGTWSRPDPQHFQLCSGY